MNQFLQIFNRRISICVVASVVLLGLVGTSIGQAEKALEKASNRVWYDPEEKSLVFPAAEPLQKAEDVLKDRHRYVDYNVPPPSANNKAWWDFFASIGEFFSSLVGLTFWTILAVFVVAVGVYFWLAIDRGWLSVSRRNGGDEREVEEREQAKIVDLPFNIDTPVKGLLGQADAFRLAGDYSRAIVYLFSHVLVILDEADCIRLQRGKTNRIYLRELKEEPSLVELHRYLMQVFEAVFFGRYVVSREQCDRCWSLLPRIEKAIQEAKQHRTAPSEVILPSLAAIGLPSSLASRVSGLLLFGCLAIAGCDRNSNLPKDKYGESNHSTSYKNISGLSVFRALCEEKGLRTFELKSLSQRTYKLNTILWAPKDFRVPSSKEILWFDEWLSGDTARTLVFVGRDFSPAAHYWQQAVLAANPEDRRTFRLHQAYVETAMEIARSNADPETMECDWFDQGLEPKLAQRIEKFRGPWAKEVDRNDTSVILRGSLKPNMKARTGKSTSNATTTSSTVMAEFESDSDMNLEKIEFGSPTVQTYLRSADGTPVISSMSYRSWGQSRLILVANGSFLMNESIASNGNQKLASRLIAEFAPNSKIGFLSNMNETRIRAPWDQQEPKGFELMRVWPLSLISIQGLFLGFIALLALLPIFGRPQRLPVSSTTDFGKHIEALGDLLLRARDRNYALQRISDYFREVRRDFASPWASVAPPDDSSIPSVPSTPNPLDHSS